MANENFIKLYVGNLSPDVTKEDLTDFMKKAARVRTCNIHRVLESNKTQVFGIVEYKTEGECLFAFEKLNGRILKGNAVQLDWYDNFYREKYPNLGINLKGGCDPHKRLCDDFGKIEIFDNEGKLTPQIIEVINNFRMSDIVSILMNIRDATMQTPEATKKLLIENPYLCYSVLHAQLLVGLVKEKFKPLGKRQFDVARKIHEKRQRLASYAHEAGYRHSTFNDNLSKQEEKLFEPREKNENRNNCVTLDKKKAHIINSDKNECMHLNHVSHHVFPSFSSCTSSMQRMNENTKFLEAQAMSSYSEVEQCFLASHFLPSLSDSSKEKSEFQNTFMSSSALCPPPPFCAKPSFFSSFSSGSSFPSSSSVFPLPPCVPPPSTLLSQPPLLPLCSSHSLAGTPSMMSKFRPPVPHSHGTAASNSAVIQPFNSHSAPNYATFSGPNTIHHVSASNRLLKSVNATESDNSSHSSSSSYFSLTHTYSYSSNTNINAVTTNPSVPYMNTSSNSFMSSLSHISEPINSSSVAVLSSSASAFVDSDLLHSVISNKDMLHKILRITSAEMMDWPMNQRRQVLNILKVLQDMGYS